MSKNVKKRFWAFVLYPESAPSDWRDMLSRSGLAAAVSPLHDKDLNPDGEPKKAHYHVLVSYAGPTTFNAVSTFTAGFNATIPQPLESVRGYYRYLTHLDNPEKYQYDSKDIQLFGGFCISDFVELSKREIAEIIHQICDFCEDNVITEYFDLCHVLGAAPDLFEWYQVAVSHTLFFTAYLRSFRFVVGAVPAVRPDKGEGKPALETLEKD